jgi:EmrB/QacA subfamily drug resistance transporter
MSLSRSQQRTVILVSIFASFVAFLDGFIVNVALPAIERELGGGITTQQWVVNAYVVTLGSLMLTAGALSDTFGRKKVLSIGLIGFGISSLLCAIAPTAEFLVIARALQGIAGALLVPSSLAIIISTFSGTQQSKAIGTWTAWTVVAPAIGPLLGGFLADSLSWRWVFWVNLLPIVITLWLLSRLKLPETKHEKTKVDVTGTLLCTVGLGSIVYGLTMQPLWGWQNPSIYILLLGGLGAIIAFIWYEAHTKKPMLPLRLFKVRNFAIGNIATAAIYGALALSTFILTIFIQQIGGFSATAAGIALLPITLLMFTLSQIFGKAAGKYGPRFFMGFGPLLMAAGFTLLLPLDETINYWTDMLPGITLFGLGLSVTVAPLTSAILGSIDPRHSGIGSGINNAVSRIAGLIAVALLGIIIGGQLSTIGFRNGMLFSIILLAVGGIISLLWIQNSPRKNS